MTVYALTSESLTAALQAAPKFGNRNDWNLLTGPIGEWAAMRFLEDNRQKVGRAEGNAHDIEIYLPNRWIYVEVKTRSAGRTPPRPDCRVSAPARRVFRQSSESDLFIFAWRWHQNGEHFVALVGWEYANEVKRWPLTKEGTRWEDADDVAKYDVLREQIRRLRPMSELIKKLNAETL